MGEANFYAEDKVHYARYGTGKVLKADNTKKVATVMFYSKEMQSDPDVLDTISPVKIAYASLTLTKAGEIRKKLEHQIRCQRSEISLMEEWLEQREDDRLDTPFIAWLVLEINKARYEEALARKQVLVREVQLIEEHIREVEELKSRIVRLEQFKFLGYGGVVRVRVEGFDSD